MKINEIFYSIQGEGHFAGTPAVFVRFSGCNLKCGFCDTEHQSYNEMTAESVLREVESYPSRHIVITGGEPSLQLTGELVDLLHDQGYFVQVETNGSIPLPGNVDWITCSPKDAPVVYEEVDELKLVFLGRGLTDMSRYDGIKAKVYCLQPCDTGDSVGNRRIVEETIESVKLNPKWKLSLQTHKILDVR